MKVMTILGTRPEVIRLSRLIGLLDRFTDHVLVHTGQNYDQQLNGIFFEQLGVRAPDEHLQVGGGHFGAQLGQIFEGCERLFRQRRPDRLVILGDTNSGLSAVVAKRMGIPVYHLEAGNRCFDDRVPEETNRRIIDHCSSVLMPYTHRSRENLLREGFEAHRVYVTGNPIREVLESYSSEIDGSNILELLNLTPGQFFVVTMHRAENVDVAPRLRQLVDCLTLLRQEFGYPVICSVHPRTRAKLKQFEIDTSTDGVRFLDPLGFFDFVKLEKSCFCTLSDSGTVQEEACLFGVPNVTLRDTTERPETLECGSNVLASVEPAHVLNCVKLVTRSIDGPELPVADVLPRPGRGRWTPPDEYLATRVSETVCRIVTSYRAPDLAELDWRARSRG